jgi:hypothetical protein
MALKSDVTSAAPGDAALAPGCLGAMGQGVSGLLPSSPDFPPPPIN